MVRNISNMEDVLDVRDIIERFEELEADKAEFTDAITEAKEELQTLEHLRLVSGTAEHDEDIAEHDEDIADTRETIATSERHLAEWEQSEDGQQFAELSALLNDLSGNGGDEQWRGDWYPVTMVCDSYFQDYAQELAEDIGAINKDATWPNTCIDWEQAARELRMDYSSVEYGNTTYWYR
jgi:antirestriction protein